MTDQVSEALGGFFDFIWGDTPGQVYIATLNKGGGFTQYMPEWPRHRDAIVRQVLAENAEGKDVYYCPSIFVPKADAVDVTDTGGMRATRENVKGAQVYWVDLDGNAPQDWAVFAKEKDLPEPSLIIQSSTAERQHVYWRTEFQNTDSIEERNRALGFTVGADASGWDANQLLRPPYTNNYGYGSAGKPKPWFKGQPLPVGIAGPIRRARVGDADFGSLVAPERSVVESLALGEDLPAVAEVLSFNKVTPELFEQLNLTQQEASERSPNKRSGSLQRLAYLAAEAGFTDEHIYVLLDDADRRWEKYIKRSPSQRKKILFDTIAKARVKVGYVTEESLTFAGLIGNAIDEVEEGKPKLVYGFEDFMALDVKIDWHIEGLMAHRGIGLITGSPGTGKTQMGIQLGMHMALGSAKAGGWNLSGGERKVLFLSCEMDKEPLRIFYNAISPAYSEHVRQLQKNFLIAPIGGSVPLDKTEGVAFLENLLADHRPDVLFIDSLQKVISKSLTNEDAAKELMNNLMKLKKQYNVAIYLVHHNRKESKDKNGSYTKQDLNDLYGSVFIAAEVDFVVALRKTSTKNRLAVDMWKQRLAEERDTFYIERDEYLQFKEVTNDNDDLSFDGLRIIGNTSSGSPDTDEGKPSLNF